MRPDFRGRQVGAVLIDQLLTNLLALGIRTLQTEVAWQSPELIALMALSRFAAPDFSVFARANRGDEAS